MPVNQIQESDKNIQPARSAPLKKQTQERVYDKREEVSAEIETLNKRLNRQLTPVKKAVADLTYFITHAMNKKIDQEAAAMTHEVFPKYFDAELTRRIDDLLTDPEGYMEKISEYESICPLPIIGYSTEKDNFKLIMGDPIRKMEEACAKKAIVSNGLMNGDTRFVALDIGTGYGRLARAMEEALSYIYQDETLYVVFGLDILEKNIEDARKLNSEIGSSVIFVEGNMNTLPFQSSIMTMVNSATTHYINPRHRRPLEMAEMARVLTSAGGEGVITGPNEKFDLNKYAYIMITSNIEQYKDPKKIAIAASAGPQIVKLEEYGKYRADMGFPHREETLKAITDGIDAEIIDVYHWPNGGIVDLYSGFTFVVDDSTKKKMSRYIDFRESQGDVLIGV